MWFHARSLGVLCLVACSTPLANDTADPMDTQPVDTTQEPPSTADTAPASPPPLDVVWAIDGSGDMVAEVEAVVNELNGLFATLDAAGRDPRFTVLARHGPDAPDVCVPAPLGRDDCEGPPPTGDALTHLDVTVASTDMWCVLLSSLPSLQGRLRDDAHTVVVQVTSDGVGCDPGTAGPAYDDGDAAKPAETAADAFLADVGTLGLPGVGTVEAGTLSFVSIVGQAPPARGVALGPEEPVVEEVCNSAPDPGTGYQVLSMRSGRPRYSTCSLNTEPAAVFAALADELIGN